MNIAEKMELTDGEDRFRLWTLFRETTELYIMNKKKMMTVQTEKLKKNADEMNKILVKYGLEEHLQCS